MEQLNDNMWVYEEAPERPNKACQSRQWALCTNNTQPIGKIFWFGQWENYAFAGPGVYGPADLDAIAKFIRQQVCICPKHQF